MIISASSSYRKFDTNYMRLFQGDDVRRQRPADHDHRRATASPCPLAATPAPVPDAGLPQWQRWNDYGIGLLRKTGRGELRQAEEAFEQVERCGRPDGPLNLARVYLREGRLDEAVAALASAATLRAAGTAVVGDLVHRAGQHAERLPRRGDRELS